jgi:hypothetical protein
VRAFFQSILVGLLILGAALQLAVAADAPPPTTLEPPKIEIPSGEPKLVRSNWQSLYLARKKIGYVAQSLYDLPDGGRRLQTNTFLMKYAGADKFGFYKMITADVDHRFRPRALECRVFSGDRSWQVTGRVEGSELVLVRTVGEKSATARIPLDEDVTFLSWTLQATMLTGGQGETKRWLPIDESLGALLPNECLVRILGPPRSLTDAGGKTLSGVAVMWVCGPEQVAHVIGQDGRTLRSVWQSTPLIGEAASLSEARRPQESAQGPQGPVIEGIESERYKDARCGFSLWVPPYPFTVHAAPQVGAVEITDLTDEAYLVMRLATLPRVPSGGEAVTAPPAQTLDQTARLADLIQREWAAGFEDVKAEAPRTEQVGGRDALMIPGTVRLGCTTFCFRNYFLASEGRTYFVSVAVADRPVTAESPISQTALQSLRLAAPEGPLPLQVSGDTIRSPYHGFELARPNAQWGIPHHVDGPVTVLELARRDQAALALVRILTLKPGQTLETLVADQAQLAAENLSVPKPEPKSATLGGRQSLEIAYDGGKILSGRPARCRLVFTKLDGRVFCLTLISAAGDATAEKELQQIRESVKLLRPEASK